MIDRYTEISDPFPNSMSISSRLQHFLFYRKADHPKTERVFSQKIFYLPFGVFLSVLIVFSLVAIGYADSRGFQRLGVEGFFRYAIVGLLAGWCLAMGFFSRCGVNRNRVWSRFGPFFYREVRFDEMDEIRYETTVIRCYAGKRKINLECNRYDYTFAYIRILEELQHRRIAVHGIGVNDPRWKETVQVYRQALGEIVYATYRDYYEANLAEFARLDALTRPPVSYIN